MKILGYLYKPIGGDFKDTETIEVLKSKKGKTHYINKGINYKEPEPRANGIYDEFVRYLQND